MNLLTVFVVVAMGTGTAYLLRKGWFAFHKAVGISPETMIYIPPEQYQPVLLHLPLDKIQLMALPVVMRQKLAIIDNKSQQLQFYNQQLSAQHKLSTDERYLVLQKLLQNTLPQAVSHYQHIQPQPMGDNQPYIKSVNSTKDNAKILISHIIDDVEMRLDALLAECQQGSLNELRIIKRYLDSR